MNKLISKCLHKSEFVFCWFSRVRFCRFAFLFSFVCWLAFLFSFVCLSFLFLSFFFFLFGLLFFLTQFGDFTFLDIWEELGDIFNAQFFNFLREKIPVVGISVDVNQRRWCTRFNCQPLGKLGKVTSIFSGVSANQCAFLAIFFQSAF